MTSLAYALEVALKEIRTTDLETFLHHLRGKLIHAVLGGIAKHMVDSAAAVLRSAMFADMLDAPVAELSMSYNVDVIQHLVDTWTL